MSREDQPKSPPRSVEELRMLLGRAANLGAIRFSRHGMRRAAQRSIDFQDYVHALRRSGWDFGAAPNYDADHGNWEYLIASEDAEGEPLHIKFAFREDEGIVEVISAW